MPRIAFPLLTALLTAFLLAGCRVVFIPIPVPVNQGAPIWGAPVATPVGTEAAESETGAAETADLQAARDELEQYQTFLAKYDALEAPYDALTAHLNAMAFDDPDWRAETVRLAQEWRTAVDDLRRMPQPQGAPWVKAWPALMQAMDEYAYVAGAVENAAATNQPLLMQDVRSRLVNGVNLTAEAMRLLGE